MVRGALKRGCEEVSRATPVVAPRSRAEAAIVTGAAAVGATPKAAAEVEVGGTVGTCCC
jgi:hypothetical protein